MFVKVGFFYWYHSPALSESHVMKNRHLSIDIELVPILGFALIFNEKCMIALQSTTVESKFFSGQVDESGQA